MSFLKKSSLGEFENYVENLRDTECDRLHVLLNELIKKENIINRARSDSVSGADPLEKMKMKATSIDKTKSPKKK